MTDPTPAPDTDPGHRPDVRIRLLGGVAAEAGAGGPSPSTLDVGPAKCQLLLAALALSPRSAVPVTRLVELVWGDEPPRTAEKTLQSYATQLRKALGADRVVRTGSAYRLDVEPGAVDVTRFEQRLSTGDIAGALAEWGGPPLAGLDPAGLSAPVAGLTERWLGAVENDLEQAIERDPVGAVARLTELTRAHPFREGLWALLMTALYASGRQAEALSAFRQARTHLVEELGVEPGPRLRDLEARILDQDAALTAGPTPADTALGSTAGAAIPTGTVTFAFSDVEGSTRLWAADREQTARAIGRHETIVRTATASAGGHVFATGGDSFGVAFDRADTAARWAIEVQAAVAAEPWPAEADLRVRIGLHTGDAEERDGNYYGPSVNLAARIADAGHGGQILLSPVTAALLSAAELRTDLRELGPVRLEGIAADQTVLQLGQGRHPPLRAQDSREGHLPRPAGRLFGRAELLDATVAALRATPVVTLVGPGGIGKTRLGLAAAELASAELGTGAWLVELADLTSPDEVVRAVADQTRLKQLPGRTLTESVVGALTARGALLILDNCEHVIDGAAELVDALLLEASATTGPADRVRVLATSREGLGLPGEQLLAVGPLDLDGAAVELFDQRASAVDASYEPEPNRAAVIEICRRLDGVPLAIELAAARVRTLPPADLVERLDDSFRVLSGGRRRSVERHRTLRATIQWSHDLLSEPEQILFRRLSVFAGSFDLHGAEQVAAPATPTPRAGDDDGGGIDPAEVGGLLDDLVERSMVLVDSGRSGRRFRLLETMRQFGNEQLGELDDPTGLARRHAHHVADEVATIAELLSGWSEIDGAGRLIELWPNLRAAFDWAESAGDLDLARRLVTPLAPQIISRRGVSELADWAERLMAMAGPDDDETLANGLLWTALQYSMTSDHGAYERVVERFGTPDHPLARAADAAMVADSTSVPPVVEETQDELRRQGQHLLARLFDVFLAGSLLGDGKLDEADGLIDPMVERFQQQGPPTFLNWALYMQAAAADLRGRSERAEELYDRALGVEVPPQTNSPNEVLRARTLFRRGERRQAFAVLRDYAAELLETSNLSGATVLAIEFINLMVADDRLDLAAWILGYIDHTGLLDVEGPAFRLLVEDASRLIDGHPDARPVRQRAAGEHIDDRGAIETVIVMLGQLLDQST